MGSVTIFGFQFETMRYLVLILILAAGMNLPLRSQNTAKPDDRTFTGNFDIRSCTFETTGRNRFVILEPGYQLVLTGKEGSDTVSLTVTVLDSVKVIRDRKCRAVEERKVRNGKLAEVVTNFYSFCRETGTVFHFGKLIDRYRDGKVAGSSGSWLAEADFLPGVMMPGLALLGARYYHQICDAVSLDRAEVISLTEDVHCPAGTFPGCLKTEETSGMRADRRSYKYYSPGLGLVRDGELYLVRYGFVK